jgi:predicted PurR-regulated permease PerM
MRGILSTHSTPLNILLFLACFYTLYLAREIFLPITIGMLLFFLLSPFVEFLARIRVPRAAGAGLVVIGLFGAFGIALFFLADPAAKWLEQFPQVVEQLQKKVEEPVQEMEDARKQVEKMIEMGEEAGKAAGGSDDAAAGGMSLGLVGIATSVATFATDLGWGVLVIFVLLFFLLSTGDLIQHNLVGLFSRPSERRQVLEIIQRLKQDVSRYLFTFTLINIGLGIAIGTGMYLVGLPNPVLWGVMAGVLNYVPYIGPTIGASIVVLVGLFAFDELSMALLPGAVYLSINVLEGNVVTPMILGRSLTLNPVVVFLSVVFWGWLWGIPGGLIAVPLLASIKVVCSGVERLHWAAHLLGGARSD